MKIVLTYSELRALLHPVIPHAGTDDNLPVLTTVAVASSGAYLVAQATDRFTAGFKRVQPAAKPPKGFGVLMQRSDAQRLLNLLRPDRGSDPQITLTVKDGQIRVETKSAGLALGFVGFDVSFLQPILGHEKNQFPDLGGLLPKRADFEKAAAASGFNLTFLTRFRAAMDASNLSKHEQTLVIHMGSTPAKPLIVTVEDDFVGIIMPRRSTWPTSTVEIIDDWRDMVPRSGVRPPGSGPAPVIDQSEPAPEPIGASS